MKISPNSDILNIPNASEFLNSSSYIYYLLWKNDNVKNKYINQKEKIKRRLKNKIRRQNKRKYKK